MSWIALVVLLILVFGVAPVTPWYRSGGSSYGWAPSGFLGLIALVILVLILMGRI